jgi:uncharacterized membrane protein
VALLKLVFFLHETDANFKSFSVILIFNSSFASWIAALVGFSPLST